LDIKGYSGETQNFIWQAIRHFLNNINSLSAILHNFTPLHAFIVSQTRD